MSTGFGDLKVFSGSAHPQLTREIADFLGIPVGQARLPLGDAPEFVEARAREVWANLQRWRDAFPDRP